MLSESGSRRKKEKAKEYVPIVAWLIELGLISFDDQEIKDDASRIFDRLADGVVLCQLLERLKTMPQSSGLLSILVHFVVETEFVVSFCFPYYNSYIEAPMPNAPANGVELLWGKKVENINIFKKNLAAFENLFVEKPKDLAQYQRELKGLNPDDVQQGKSNNPSLITYDSSILQLVFYFQATEATNGKVFFFLQCFSTCQNCNSRRNHENEIETF
jgi:hypothetical protein